MGSASLDREEGEATTIGSMRSNALAKKPCIGFMSFPVFFN